MLNKNFMKKYIEVLQEVSNVKDEYVEIYEITKAYQKLETLEKFINDEFDIPDEVYMFMYDYASDGFLFDDDGNKVKDIDTVIDMILNYEDTLVYWTYCEELGWFTMESKEGATNQLYKALSVNSTDELPYNYRKLYRIAGKVYGYPLFESIEPAYLKDDLAEVIK